MAAPMLRLHMLSEYEDSAIVNARVGASKMGFFTSDDAEGFGGEPDASTGELITGAEPGTFEQLPTGTTFQSFHPDYPNGEFGTFCASMLRGIASGLGVSYNTLANDLSDVNFSSMRHGALEERELWKTLQNWLIEAFHQRVFVAWLTESSLRGNVKGIDPTQVGAIAENISWQPRRWQWVDPAKEMKANLDAISARLRSRSDIIREMGRDPEDVWLEIQREQDLLRELGIGEVEQIAVIDTQINPVDKAALPNAAQQDEDAEDDAEAA